MARHKHSKKVEREDETDDGSILMLSLRPGNIQLPDGTVIVRGKAFRATPEQAEWLECSFKEYIQRID